MQTKKKPPEKRAQELQRKNKELRLRLAEAEETLRAIHEGEVDAVVVSGRKGEQIYSLVGADSIYRLIVETMREAAFMVSLEGIILFCNAQFGEFVKQPMERILGRPLREFVSRDDRSASDSLLAQARNHPVKDRLVFSDAGGKAKPAHISAGVLDHQDGPSICIVATDLSDLESSSKLIRQLCDQREELNRQRAQLEAIFKYLPVGIIIAESPSGKIVLSNERVEQIWKHEKFSQPECKSEYDKYKGFHANGQPYLSHEWPLARTIASGERVLQEEVRFQRGDVSFGWMSINSAPIRGNDGKIIMGMVAFTDITARKQAEEELLRMNEALERRVAERTKEVQQRADELRALAAQLIRSEQEERSSLARILHDHIQQLIVAGQFQLEYIRQRRDMGFEELQQEIQQANNILDEALEASRSLAVDLYPPALHKGGLIQALKWLAVRMRGKYYFTVNLGVADDAEPTKDELRFFLFDCARELLLNAVKHSGVREADIDLSRTNKNTIQMIVRDLGKGFDIEKFQNRNPEESTFGLFSIQQRLIYMGGRIEIKSVPGKGTTVMLVAPDHLIS